jgi:hypothetical protein
MTVGSHVRCLQPLAASIPGEYVVAEVIPMDEDANVPQLYLLEGVDGAIDGRYLEEVANGNT